MLILSSGDVLDAGPDGGPWPRSHGFRPGQCPDRLRGLYRRRYLGLQAPAGAKTGKSWKIRNVRCSARACAGVARAALSPGWLSRPRRRRWSATSREVVGDGAALRAADALGQADERADDLGRALRLVSPTGAATATSTGTPTAALAAIPAAVLAVWRRVSGAARDPDCCLVNYYGDGARMGLHRDGDEADFSWPVLSISLGDPRSSASAAGARRPDRKPLAALGRRGGDGRRGAARLSRHRPHPRRRLDAAARGRRGST